jgi:hypothetical protein
MAAGRKLRCRTDTVAFPSVNSCLDTIQAMIPIEMLDVFTEKIAMCKRVAARCNKARGAPDRVRVRM